MQIKFYLPALFLVLCAFTACDRNSDNASTSGAGTNSAADTGPGGTSGGPSTDTRGPGTGSPPDGTGGGAGTGSAAGTGAGGGSTRPAR